MIETLILSPILGIIGGAISYLILNKTNSKYVKNTKLNKSTTISISDSIFCKNGKIVRVYDNDTDIMIGVGKSGIKLLHYAGK